VWALLNANSQLEEDDLNENTEIEIPTDQQEADDEMKADMAMEELIHTMTSVMQVSSD
jgi:hypothetical protein